GPVCVRLGDVGLLSSVRGSRLAVGELRPTSRRADRGVLRYGQESFAPTPSASHSPVRWLAEQVSSPALRGRVPPPGEAFPRLSFSCSGRGRRVRQRTPGTRTRLVR